MKNESTQNDQELLDLLQSQDTQTSPTEWSAMLTDLRNTDETQTSAGFVGALRRRLEREIEVERRPARRMYFPRLAVPLMAAAAVIAFVLLWTGSVPTPGNGPSSAPGVVWGDVVKAMQDVQQFRILAFDDSPNVEDRAPITRFDVFYQHPGRWRAQAIGQVEFAEVGRTSRIWSVKKGGWLGEKDPQEEILPVDFIEKHQKLGTLGAVLSMFFGGDVPKGSPVKSDEVATAQGIDVFDYAKDASEQWTRIWVLRESKLPMKMHVYMPESDSFLLINFDYSDPQPPMFFDAEAFAVAAAKIDGSDERRVFRIGSKPVAGTQPRGADQIYDVKGYKAPKVLRVVSNDAGDVMVITERRENTTPEGRQPHFEGFRKITDNWGNRFAPAGMLRKPNEQRWTYMPLPPVKIGTEPRTLTVSYMIEPTYNEPPIKLADRTLDVPAPKADPVWRKELESEKATWYRNYLVSNGSLAEQLAEVERRLAGDPKSVDALLWKHELLRRYGRADEAGPFFEQHLLNITLSDPRLLERSTVAISQYLLHLAATGREDEMRRISAQINEIVDKLSATTTDPRNRRNYYTLLSKEHNPLYQATHLLEWRDKYKGGPTLLRTATSKDGYVFVEFEVPEPTASWQANGWDGTAPMGWFWDARAESDGWTRVSRAAQPAKRRLGLLFRGSGKQFTIGGEAMLQADNYVSPNPKNDFKLKWQRTIEVPEASIEKMPAWFTEQVGPGVNVNWYGSPAASQPAATENAVQKLLDDGDKFRKGGQFEEALKTYEKVLAAPRDQWPASYRDALGIEPDLVEGRKRRVRIARATCLAQLKRFDEARAEAAKIRAALTGPPDLNDPLQAMITTDAMLAELEVAKALLAAGDPAAATAELKRIEARRPNAEDLNQGTVMIPRGSASFGWNPSHHNRDAWRTFDSVWWDVHDAVAKSK